MATILYHDNDADLLFRKIPPNATVNWAVTTMDEIASRPVIPVHPNLTGVATWNPARRRFEDVLEGDDITQYLPPTDETVTPNTPLYAIVFWWGANLRKAIPNVVVRTLRT